MTSRRASSFRSLLALSASCSNATAVVGGRPADGAAPDDTPAMDAMDAACGAGLTTCGGACVSVTSSPLHCGACGRACRDGDACQNGACVPACGAGETLCGSADAGLSCANTDTDNRHCGLCDRACSSDQVCSGGVCTFSCRAGLSECARPDGDGGSSRFCADTQTDRAHCGACGNACMEGYGCAAAAARCAAPSS